ncbi:MAG: TlyA family RNA methyltransferase [Patescibacteria group bacterium]
MKQRLDLELVSRQLSSTRSQAQLTIRLGLVFVNRQKAISPSQTVDQNSIITINQPLKYVSRGGLKLEHALKEFNIKPKNYTCLDIGASTGGFTDCLLQNGAKKVYALDVGTHQLADKLKLNPRVISLEQTNFRHWNKLPETINLVVIDVSFISITSILNHLKKIFSEYTAQNILEIGNRKLEIVCLLKPQFEAGPKNLRKGVVKNPKIHELVKKNFRQFCQENNFSIINETTSPLLGPKGNKEFLFYLKLNQNL